MSRRASISTRVACAPSLLCRFFVDRFTRKPSTKTCHRSKTPCTITAIRGGLRVTANMVGSKKAWSYHENKPQRRDCVRRQDIRVRDRMRVAQLCLSPARGPEGRPNGSEERAGRQGALSQPRWATLSKACLWRSGSTTNRATSQRSSPPTSLLQSPWSPRLLRGARIPPGRVTNGSRLMQRAGGRRQLVLPTAADGHPQRSLAVAD